MSALASLEGVPALLEAKGVPALSLAYVTGADAEPIVHAWGVASTDTQQPVEPNTLFLTGSLSKPVTAFAALRLGHEGALDLDADVNSLLKGWKLPTIAGWQPSVTVRMLLAHVAGTSGWGDSTGYTEEKPPKNVVDVLDGQGDRPALTFHSPPNLVWNYSSGGYLVVQALIEQITKLPFPEAVRGLVFDSLGMSSSTFETPLSAEFRSVAADGHVDGGPVAAGVVRNPAMADGGLWSTPSDLIRLGRAVNTGAAPEMLEGHSVEPRMGLGLFLNSESGITWWSHGGSTTGFESLLVGTARGFAAVAMTNASGGFAVISEVIDLVSSRFGPGSAVLRHLTWEGISAAIRMNKFNAEAIGHYRLPSGLELILEATAPDKWGQTHVQLHLPGQPPILLAWPITDGHWHIPGFEALLVFDPPNTIRFIQSGREVRAKRI